MTTCLVGFISLLGSLSCSGPDPIGPRQDTLRPAPMLAVGSSGPCARVHVQIVGGTTAQASFAADSGCATGLALVGAGAVGYVKNQRKVSIPVRVVNRGPGGRDAPILVVLPRDSGVVTAPSNITARVVESNADSVGASGGPDQGAAFWTLLGSGGTITGDSTPVRTVQLVVPNKTTAARISFEIRAELPDSALPIAPNRTLFPEEGAYSLKPGLSHDPDAVYYRRLIALWLKPGVTGPTFRAVLERYAAELVGGDPSDGLMILRIADRGPSWTALTAVLDSIRAEEIVDFAGLYRNDELASSFDSSAVHPSRHRRLELPDSALPTITDRMTFAAESLFVIQDSLLPGYDYYRRMIGMRLRPDAAGLEFRSLLQKYGAELAGGASSIGLYILRFPDPGPGWANVKALLDSLHAEPIVRVAYPMTRSSGPGRAPGRIAPASEGARRTGAERVDSLQPRR